MTEQGNKKTKSLQDIKFKFDDFVQKYKEFCIDKILTNYSSSFPDSSSNDKMIDDFVTREIPVISNLNDNDYNCLNELNNVSEIIEKLFESEETFIKAMDSDIAKFNELYNCYKYGNLDDPGIIIEKKAQISGEGRGDSVGEGVVVSGHVPVGEGGGGRVRVRDRGGGGPKK